jgi:hypothetical protein
MKINHIFSIYFLTLIVLNKTPLISAAGGGGRLDISPACKPPPVAAALIN